MNYKPLSELPRRHKGTKKKMKFKPISEEIEIVARKVIDAAYVVHKELGPGLLEKVYEICFCYELSKRGLKFKKQVNIPIVYDGKILDESFRIDVLIEDKIICEIKAVIEMNPVYEAQILTYMKLTNKRLGFLINFNVPLIKDGIKRIIL
jgi:GxxExxY protein